MENDVSPTAPPSSGDSRKRFIRTFARDADTFQKGGTPELAPYERQSPAERLIEASPIAEVAVAPVRPPQLSSVPLPVHPRPEPTPSPLETYAGDFNERIKSTHGSTLAVLAAEQDAGAAPTAPETEESKDPKNIFFIVGGLILLLVSIVGVGIAYSQYVAATAPVIVAPAATAPIFVDSIEQVSGSGSSLQQAVQASVKKSLALGTVRLLTLVPATDASVFSALATNAPGILVRNINPVKSMAGIVNTGSGQSPFFILSVGGAYSATFSGVLSWEPTMQSDLATLFPFYPVELNMASTTTTTTQKFVPQVITPKSNFRDEVVSNHDVRIYRDAQNKSLLLYGYWNQQTLVIARDPAAFTEILTRLATSHTK